MINLAVGRPAWQSSTYSNPNGPAVAERAVDGNEDSEFDHNSCSHTDNGDDSPWLAADLEQITKVQYVAVINRGDNWGKQSLQIKRVCVT